MQQLLLKYKVNKIKKEEEELFNKINTFTHEALESKKKQKIQFKKN